MQDGAALLHTTVVARADDDIAVHDHRTDGNAAFLSRPGALRRLQLERNGLVEFMDATIYQISAIPGALAFLAIFWSAFIRET